MPRILDPLPLFDEASLLAACAHHTEGGGAISGIHPVHLWKHLLRQELDQFHPGYIERINSRMGSRATSRAASRLASRRASVDNSSNNDDESKSDASGDVAVASPRSHTSIISEGDESAADVELDAAAEATTADAQSNTDSTDTAEQEQFELERQAKLRLEAEDDELLAGLTIFPRSRFNPTAEELADPNNPLHTKPIVPETLKLTGLPGRMYPMLAQKFSYLTSRLQSHKTSADGTTTKLLIRLQDGQHIESVIMRHKQKDVATGNVEQRITLCVSSQVGCAMACTFCSTGTMGFRGNLMAGEILEQLIIANRFEKIRNIVFMGMGEPLKNYEQVLAAIRGMTDGNRFGLAPSRITLSTVGVIPKMLELTRDIPSIQLALSLHAPTQELRQQIVPTAKSYPIEKLIDAMDYFIQRSKKRILIEYVLLDGINASDKEAHELGALLKGKDVMINLIPYNSTSVAASYHAPSRADSQRFQAILTNEYALFTTIRVEMGADINGACGQLALENQDLAMQLKPRGLMDDTATPSLMAEEIKTACGTVSSDMEDIGGGGRAKKPTVTKRRAAATPSTASTATAAPAVAASPASSTCKGGASPCDCGESNNAAACCSSTPTASCSTAPAVAAESAEEGEDEDLDEDTVTVADLLKQSGIKTYAELRASATAAVAKENEPRSPDSVPLVSPTEARLLASEKAPPAWQRADRLQQVLIGVIFLVAALIYTFVQQSRKSSS